MSALPVPAPEPFDLEATIGEAFSAELHGARMRQAFGSDLHRAVETTRLFDKLAADHDYDPVMLDLATDARRRVDDLFDRRPRQMAILGVAWIAEQTMRSV